MVAQKIRSGKGLCFSFLIIIPASPHMVFCYVSQTGTQTLLLSAL